MAVRHPKAQPYATHPGSMRLRPGSLSILMLTYNESLNVEKCLESVSTWCQEIHVVDSGSTDGTVELVRKYTDHVYFHEYLDHRSQLSWALQNVRFRSEWLLVLDADNVVTPALAQQIAETLAHTSIDTNGYFVAHHYYFHGQRMRGFKPWSLRLLRLGHFTIDKSEMVDFRFVVSGQLRYLSGVMIESNKKEDDINFWIDKHQHFAARLAIEEYLRRHGYLSWSHTPRLFGTADERIAWFKERWYRMPLFLRPVLYYIYRYFFRLGVLDGRKGIIYHCFHALWFRLLIDIGIAEVHENIVTGRCTISELTSAYSGS
jgi:glycosyltransferase involved in cell wall biosynthesis